MVSFLASLLAVLLSVFGFALKTTPATIQQPTAFMKTTPSVTLPSATIIKLSLIATSSTPTITGTADSLASVYVAVTQTTHPGYILYVDPRCPVIDSFWSLKVSRALANGTYTVDVFDWRTNTLLTTGALIVNSQPKHSGP
jgi:hypothetical protein